MKSYYAFKEDNLSELSLRKKQQQQINNKRKCTQWVKGRELWSQETNYYPRVKAREIEDLP